MKVRSPGIKAQQAASQGSSKTLHNQTVKVARRSASNAENQILRGGEL
jgi:hypothetical protein